MATSQVSTNGDVGNISNVQSFNHSLFGELRTLGDADNLWFVAKDVCDSLGFNNPSDATKYLDDDEKALINNPSLTNNPNGNVTIINESGLYSLILRSRKPEAKRFKKWVTSEVLPSIRKHGGYMTPEKVEEVLSDPDTIIKLATNLKEERAKRIEAEQRIEQDRPKVVFAESIETAETTILIGELAKLIQQSTQYKIGQNRLFDYLRQNGYLHKGGSSRNMPTQRSMDLGLFEIKETAISRSNGTHIAKTTKVTGKGQLYFVKKFCDKMKLRRMAAGELNTGEDCCKEAS